MTTSDPKHHSVTLLLTGGDVSPQEHRARRPSKKLVKEGNSGRAMENAGTRAPGNLLWPAAIVSVVSGGCAMAGFFLPVYMKSALRFTGSQIGCLFALFSVTAIVALLPVGLRNDRTSPRLMVALSLAVASSAALAMGKVQRFVPFLVVFALYGLGLSAFRISIDALIFKTGAAEDCGTRWGHLNAFRMTSTAVGIFCGGYVLSHLGFPGGLGLLGGILLAGVFMTPLLLPVNAVFPKFREYVWDLRQAGVGTFMLWLFLFSLHWGAEMTSYGLFLREDLGLSLSAMGWYMGLEFIPLAGACLWVGPQCDRRFDRRLLTAAGLLMSGFGQILMCVQPVWFSLVWRCVHGVGDGLIVVVMYTGIARLFTVWRIGGHNSGVNFIMMVGSFTGSLAFGPVGEKLGYEVPLVATGIVVVALAIPLLHPKRPEEHSKRTPAAVAAALQPSREG